MADAPGVELLRKSWEIEDHWVLRRDFMIAHEKKFPPDRLLCLAQIFVNMETLGVEYDDEVMDEIRQLAEEVSSLKEFRRKKVQLQSEEKFKAPPKAVKNRNEVGTRNVTHERYQSHQQNYSQSRQEYSQYQQVHGYGKAQQQQPYTGQTYGQGYNAQPQSQHYRQSGNQQQYQQQRQHQSYQPNYHQQQQAYQVPTAMYGRNAVPQATQSNPHAAQRSEYGQGQQQPQYGRGSVSYSSGGQSGQSGNSYQNLLRRGQRR